MRSRIVVMLGVGLLLTAAGGLIVVSRLDREPPPTQQADQHTAVPFVPSDDTGSPTPGGAIQRGVPLLPTRTPTPTPTDRPTNTPLPTASPAATATREAAPAGPTPEPIEWTQAEKNALSWLCYGEISGMGSVEGDACLSVISTVRARYAYPNGFAETDVIGTLLRPGQFNVPIETNRPHPDPRWVDLVEAYAAGARGSCNGYLYFNSAPDSPAECSIYGAGGLYMHFFNTWR